MTTEIRRGVVGRVFFCNPDSPFMAGVLAEEGGGEIRFSGKVAAQPGDKLEVTGKWTRHPKFGKQFEVETGLVKMDESPDALAHMLATDKRFKGLGPSRAKKVVDAALSLSTDGSVASALCEYPAEVAERSGVTIGIVTDAAALWNEKRAYFDALAALADVGWSNAQAQAIVNKLGDNAPALVGSDPYMLIGKIPRFGFKTVDTVARKMGVKSTDPQRLYAGVAFCIDRISQNGNTWTTREALLDESTQELRPDTIDGEDKIAGALASLIADGSIHVDRSPLGAEVVADARLAAAEFSVFSALRRGLDDGGVAPLRGASTPKLRALVASLNDGQAAALEGFARRRYSVISGGAGVGKTYAMDAVCSIAESAGVSVELCAPTGKAARKLSQATGRSAQTIHRLLEPIFDSETGGFTFTRNSGNPLDVGLVVLDEVSMVDVRLMRSLLDALKPTTRLLLVGDHHQIPSVGPGAILRDILAARDSYPESVHVLTEIVRQAGVLAVNTTALLDGVVVMQETPPWGVQRTEKGHEEGTAAMVAMMIESIVTAPTPLQPFNRHLDPAWDIQVLAPMKKGPLGTWALNVELQKLRQRLLGNAPPETTPDGRSPKPVIGDRVIWTKNDYELDLFNGTQATVVGMLKGGAMNLITDSGREVTIPAAKRINVEVAYAMTIHKAQGSEWPMVVVVASSKHWIMHDRNLLYTGVSRAAEAVTIIGDVQGMSHFAREKKSAARQTFGGFLVHGWQPGLAPVES
jgi:exodeoxyribonuclease V alpha subunit